MSLKQSIVVVNEFTVKNAKSGKGSRGSSPGAYVTRYMSRNGATECLTPVQFDNEGFVMRYMARKDAVDKAQSVRGIKQDMRNIQGKGGIAFGYGEVSLSDKQLRDASSDLQENFDNGKTVMKTVLSFDEAYLREHHIIDDDFEFRKKGDYRGNIDQMKLRMAIMNGLDKMARNYDDLQYIGVIQVDTEHVHCHLAMVDRGKGNITKNGTQRGKINSASKRNLRRGIDMFLDESQQVRMMTSNISHDKRNTLCFIKKYTHKTMDEYGAPQFLLACLPSNKNWWRASTNRKEMRKANQIVKDFVMQVLDEPDSGFAEALRSVDEYASTRQKREGLSDTEYKKLYENGRKRIIDDCINGVYSVLSRIPSESYQVKTPLMDSMSMDYEDMASRRAEDPIVEFGFKLRSYSSRLDYHKKERNKYHEAVKSYETAENVNAQSVPLYDFFKFEEEYNTKLMCKYQHFLSFLPPEEKYEDEFHDLMKFKHKINDTKKLYNDPSVRRMKPDNAEDYGRQVYDIQGGHYMTFAPNIILNHIQDMEVDYDEWEDEFKHKIAGYGLTLDDKGIKREKLYEFSEVKALDLHHLGYDFSEDAPISKINVDEFIETADKRYELAVKAVQYLEYTGQSDAVGQLAIDDIKIMKKTAEELTVKPVLPALKPSISGGKYRDSRTVRLDVNYTAQMKEAVSDTVSVMSFE